MKRELIGTITTLNDKFEGQGKCAEYYLSVLRTLTAAQRLKSCSTTGGEMGGEISWHTRLK